jgi:hypothetical protein
VGLRSCSSTTDRRKHGRKLRKGDGGCPGGRGCFYAEVLGSCSSSIGIAV